jgi:hypothetical protein
MDEETQNWVFLPPVPQNAAEKKRGEVAASALLKTLVPQKHGRHVTPAVVGSGTLKQKLTCQSGLFTREAPL